MSSLNKTVLLFNSMNTIREESVLPVYLQELSCSNCSGMSEHFALMLKSFATYVLCYVATFWHIF